MTPRIALVTGCSEPNSLGAAFALDLRSRGWRVFSTARNVETMKHLETAGCEILALDVTSDHSVQEAAREVHKLTHGRLDLLVNNAGVWGTGPILDTSIDHMRAMYEVNTLGPVRVTQAFASMLADTYVSTGVKSVVVNIGSIASMAPQWNGAYGSSKAALFAISESMRIEMAPLGVNVMNVQLGVVKTELNGGRTDKLFTVVKDAQDRSGYFPWDDIASAMGKAQQQGRPNVPEPRDVVRQTLNRALKSSPPRQLFTGFGAFLCTWVIPFLPQRLVDLLLNKLMFVHMIPTLKPSTKDKRQ